MSNDAIACLIVSNPRQYPFSCERLMALANKLDSLSKTEWTNLYPTLPGPAEEWCPKIVLAWLEGMAEGETATQPSKACREILDQCVSAHPDNVCHLAGWISSLSQSLDGRVSSDELFTAWASLDALVSYAERCRQLQLIVDASGAVAKEAVTGFREGYSLIQDDGSFADFDSLESQITALLFEWCIECQGRSVLEQDFLFMRHFLSKIVPLHSGSASFWNSLLGCHIGGSLERLLRGYARPVTDAPLMHLQAGSAYFDATARLETELPKLVTGWDDSMAGIADLFRLMMIFQGAGVSAPINQLLLSTTPEGVGGEFSVPLDAFDQASPAVLTWLRDRYGRDMADAWEDTLRRFLVLRQGAAMVECAVEEFHEAFMKAGEDLAVGQQQSDQRKFAFLVRECFARTAWAAVATQDLRAAMSHVRQSWVVDMGIDMANEHWKKHARVAAAVTSLQSVVPETTRLINSAAVLMRSIDGVAAASRFGVEDVVIPQRAESRLQGSGVPLSTWRILPRRAVMVQRIHPAKTAGAALASWFMESVMPESKEVGSVQLAGSVEHIAATIRNAQGGDAPDVVVQMLKRLAEQMPALATVRNLPSKVDAVADVALKRFHTENILMLLRVAATCNPARAFDVEGFKEWWTIMFTGSSGKDFGRLIVEDVEALGYGLVRQLSAPEATLVYGHIAQAVSEIMGVEIPSLVSSTFSVMPDEGPLARRLSVGKPIPLPVFWGVKDEILASAATGTNAENVRKAWSLFAKRWHDTGLMNHAWLAAIPELTRMASSGEHAAPAADLSRFGMECANGAPVAYTPFLVEACAAANRLFGSICLGQAIEARLDAVKEGWSLEVYPRMPDSFGADTTELKRSINHLGELFSEIAHIMQTQSCALGRANVAGLLCSRMFSDVVHPRATWQAILDEAGRLIQPSLSPWARDAWFHLMGLMESILDAAPDIEAVMRAVVSPTEYVFSARQQEEQEIRSLVATLIALSILDVDSGEDQSEALVEVALGTPLCAMREPVAMAKVVNGLADAMTVKPSDDFRRLAGQMATILERIDRLLSSDSFNAGMVHSELKGDPVVWFEMLSMASGESGGEDAIAISRSYYGARYDTFIAEAETRMAALKESGDLLVMLDKTLVPWGRIALAAMARQDSARAPHLAARLMCMIPCVSMGQDLPVGSIAEKTNFFLDVQPGMARVLRTLTRQMRAFSACRQITQKMDELRDAARGLVGDSCADKPMVFAPGLYYAALASSLMDPSLRLDVLGEPVSMKSCRLASTGALQMGLLKILTPAKSILPVHVISNHQSLHHAGADFETPIGKLVAPAYLAGCERIAQDIGAAVAGDQGALWSSQVACIAQAMRLDGDFEQAFAEVASDCLLAHGRETCVALARTWRQASVHPSMSAFGAATAFWVHVSRQMADALCLVSAGARLLEDMQAVSAAVSKAVREALPQEAASLDEEGKTSVLDNMNLAMLLFLSGRMQSVCVSRTLLDFGTWWLDVCLSGVKVGPEFWQCFAGAFEDEMLARLTETEQSSFLEFSGCVQGIMSQAPILSPVLDSLAATSVAERQAFGGRGFLMGLLGAAALPDHCAVPGKLLGQRLALSSSRRFVRNERSLRALSTTLLDFLNRITGNRLPASVVRRLAELPANFALIRQANGAQGDSLGWHCVALSGSPVARGCWMASLLARIDPASGMLAQSAFDMAAQQFAGWEAPRESILMEFQRSLLKVFEQPGAALPRDHVVEREEVLQHKGFLGIGAKSEKIVHKDVKTFPDAWAAYVRTLAQLCVTGAALGQPKLVPARLIGFASAPKLSGDAVPEWNLYVGKCMEVMRGVLPLEMADALQVLIGMTDRLAAGESLLRVDSSAGAKILATQPMMAASLCRWLALRGLGAREQDGVGAYVFGPRRMAAEALSSQFAWVATLPSEARVQSEQWAKSFLKPAGSL